MSDTQDTVVHYKPEKSPAMSMSAYRAFYQQSISDPSSFWDTQAKKVLTWFRLWDSVLQGDFINETPKWFVNAELNACYNCLDRHLETRAGQEALIWEGNEPGVSKRYTYQQLHREVCVAANVLKSLGVKKGDTVVIYLPMVPELVVTMLACARIGAVHSVVFSGFSADALQVRLLDTASRVVITTDESRRADKRIPLKQHVDVALQNCPAVQHVLVVKKTGQTQAWNAERDHWFHELAMQVDAECPVEWMDAADPLFILYTSGSTGKPKGVVHATGGYLVYAALSYQVIFDHQEGDVLFCTADPGWITGHSYLVYGPLANGGTTVLYEGVPGYPTFERYWHIIDAYQVTQFYTSPTALRALRYEGDEWVTQSQRSSLRVLGSVGEPISPDLWQWYYQVIGEARCPIVNTWWQTETGGIVLSDLPSSESVIPGGAGTPFFGIESGMVDENGQLVEGPGTGQLVLKHPWPGLMLTIFKDHQRYIESYLKPVSGCYLTGDSVQRDAAGNLEIIGRNDDVIKVSGHRLGSEELESALMSHESVSEVAVVGRVHDIKGESIVAFVKLRSSVKPSEALQKSLIQHHLRDKIGSIATPEHIYWVSDLPKTRSGKIMRRILRHIVNHEFDKIGDVSTLVNPEVIASLRRCAERSDEAYMDPTGM